MRKDMRKVNNPKVFYCSYLSLQPRYYFTLHMMYVNNQWSDLVLFKLKIKGPSLIVQKPQNIADLERRTPKITLNGDDLRTSKMKYLSKLWWDLLPE